MKHLEKFLFVVCLAFYAWGFVDKSFQQWPMIGGYSAFIALIAFRRRSKGEPVVDFVFMLMVACVLFLIVLQFAWLLRG
jgi:hypothetical protein